MKVVKLVSGGIDSSIMAKEYEGINLYVDFGQKYAKEEIEALKKQKIKIDIIKINSKNKIKNNIYIPDRNLFLATIAELYYNADVIMMAGLKDDNCVDKNKTEFELMSYIISRYANKEVKVVSPYWNKTKGQLIQEYKYDKKNLLKTFSCYSPKNNKPCGNCPACLRRVIALETNNIKTGIKLSDNIINEYIKKIYKYDNDRISRFFLYIKKYKKVYAIDIDGVLCKNDNNLDFKNKIKKEFKMPKDGYIILYTSRLEIDREVTEKWLKDNKIKYNVIIFNKLPYDTLYDDNVIRI